jgi:MFS family permease
MRGLPRAFWLLWLGTIINRVGSFVVPFLALYLTNERKLPVEEAGAIVAVFGAGTLFGGPMGGYFADRFGRRRTLVVAMVLGAAAMLNLGFARAPLHIAAAALVLGLLCDTHRPALMAMIADVVPPEDRTKAFGLLYWAANLGFSIAPVVAGLASGGGFVWLFVGDAATTVACAALIGTFVAETGVRRTKTTERVDYVAPYRDATFVALLVSLFLVALVFHQGFVSLPIDMGRHGISPRTFGVLIAINGVMIVTIQPLLLGIIGRARRERAVALGVLLTGFGFAANAFAHTPLTYVAAIAVWTFGEIVMTPVVPVIISDRAPPTLRGSYQGAQQMAFGASMLFAPIVGTFTLAHYGANALWGGCAVIGVVSAVGHYFAARALATHRIASEPTADVRVAA